MPALSAAGGPPNQFLIVGGAIAPNLVQLSVQSVGSHDQTFTYGLIKATNEAITITQATRALHPTAHCAEKQTNERTTGETTAEKQIASERLGAPFDHQLVSL